MGKRTVTVTGTGRANVAPDVVRLDLRVGHDAPDVAAALSGASAGITAVAAVVREQGVADADLRTLDASVNQRWDNTGVAVGFTAQQRLAVTVRELDAVGRILESAAAAVGNALLVDQVRLDVSDRSRRAPRGARRRLRRRQVQGGAVCRPRRRVAGRCARGGGGWRSTGGRRVQAEAMARDMAGGMPVEGGDLELATSVTVTWELGPPLTIG